MDLPHFQNKRLIRWLDMRANCQNKNYYLNQKWLTGGAHFPLLSPLPPSVMDKHSGGDSASNQESGGRGRQLATTDLIVNHNSVLRNVR